MPLLQNAKKALRSSKRKAVFNSRIKSILKTANDKMRKDPSKENLSSAFSSIDIAVKNKLMHKNKAARLKSQLGKLPSADKPKLEKVVKKTPAKKVTKKATKAKKTSGKK